MLKLKTRKSASKRIKIKTVFFFRHCSSLAHLRRKKNSQHLNRLGKALKLAGHQSLTFRKLLPYA